MQLFFNDHDNDLFMDGETIFVCACVKMLKRLVHLITRKHLERNSGKKRL